MSTVFHENVGFFSFSGEIVAYQELFCVVTLLASSAQPKPDNGNEKSKKRNRFNKQSKNSERAAHFLADFFRHCTTDVVKLDLNGNAIVALTLSLPNVAKGKIQQKFQISN